MHYLPNVISGARILLMPAILVCLFSGTFGGLTAALVLFVVTAASDYFDGMLARSYALSTRVGRFLDPMADKVLVLGLFVGLAVKLPELVPWWAVALIAARDFGVTSLRMWAEANGRSIRTQAGAKVKTTFQLGYLAAMLALLASAEITGSVGATAAWLLSTKIPFFALLLIVVVTLYTGAMYFLRTDYTAPAPLND